MIKVEFWGVGEIKIPPLRPPRQLQKIPTPSTHARFARRSPHLPSFLNGTDMYIADPRALVITGTAGRLARRQQFTNTIFRWTRRTTLSLGVGGLMFLALDRRDKINSKKVRIRE